MTKKELQTAIEALLQGYYEIKTDSGEISFQCGIENGRAYCEYY